MRCGKRRASRACEIHPEDAAARGIADGQMVRVFNDRGSFRARAGWGETVKPGVVVTRASGGASTRRTASTATR